ncbi:MAG: haloacid dehalogenase-like hydrolase [Terriglobales bacterium]|jgi:phosphoserine phosphatase
MTDLKPEQAAFIASVLQHSPRIATFDCDGTLWSGDAGEGFFSWELDHGIVSDEIVRWARPRYADYRAGKVAEDVMCGEMVTMHRGLREEAVQQATDTYFAEFVEPNIFPEMRALIEQLHQRGCEVWAVSSSNMWIIRSAMRIFKIPRNRILAAEAIIKDGVITDRLVRVPSGPGKVQAIQSAIKASPDCAFGNAIWDREMLSIAKHAFAINANPNLKEIAVTNGWTIYQPDLNHMGG